MNKFLLSLLIILISAQQGFCALSNTDINIMNLKEKSMYLLDLKEKAIKIDVSDKKLLEVMPLTSINNDGKLLFINSNSSGVCDVLITTIKDEYKIRFISGKVFEDISENLIKVDIPPISDKK